MYMVIWKNLVLIYEDCNHKHDFKMHALDTYEDTQTHTMKVNCQHKVSCISCKFCTNARRQQFSGRCTFPSSTSFIVCRRTIIWPQALFAYLGKKAWNPHHMHSSCAWTVRLWKSHTNTRQYHSEKRAYFVSLEHSMQLSQVITVNTWNQALTTLPVLRLLLDEMQLCVLL